MALIGSITIGLVWGWLAILMGGRRPRTWRNGLPVGGATAVLLFTLAQFASWSAAVACAGGIFLGLLFHIAFLQGLATRYGAN
ncbi:MAG: hypothetical protein OT477_21455 [Chloroflexi bacterium]|nr:hypothetical protein [Chloroflexota bacterium]